MKQENRNICGPDSTASSNDCFRIPERMASESLSQSDLSKVTTLPASQVSWWMSREERENIKKLKPRKTEDVEERAVGWNYEELYSNFTVAHISWPSVISEAMPVYLTSHCWSKNREISSHTAGVRIEREITQSAQGTVASHVPGTHQIIYITLSFLLCASAVVYVVGTYVCWGGYMCMTCLCMWRSEINIGGHFLEYICVIFETKSFPGAWGLVNWNRLVDQQAPGINLCLLSQHWNYKCTSPCRAFYMGAGDRTCVLMLKRQVF